MDKVQAEVSKSESSSGKLEQLSLQLYNLQNQIESLNTQNATFNNKLQNDYMVYIREASNQLYKQNKYSYILNTSAVVFTDPKNDISVAVSQLADKLYQADKK